MANEVLRNLKIESLQPSILATDLDGTFIPLKDNDANQRDLRCLASELQDRDLDLIFVTGRHFTSVQAAIADHRLPLPGWIICDVGTSLFARSAAGEYESVASYAQHLESRIAGHTVDDLRQQLQAITGLRLQEPEKQGPFKLSYYADAEALSKRVDQIQAVLDAEAAPYTVIASVDPFNQDGLIDLLPTGVSKAFALRWWTEQYEYDQRSIVFAGDSGNDLAALTAGYRSILVANALQNVVQQAVAAHRQQGWPDRLFLATQTATSGVLEGLRHFGKW